MNDMDQGWLGSEHEVLFESEKVHRRCIGMPKRCWAGQRRHVEGAEEECVPPLSSIPSSLFLPPLLPSLPFPPPCHNFPKFHSIWSYGSQSLESFCKLANLRLNNLLPYDALFCQLKVTGMRVLIVYRFMRTVYFSTKYSKPNSNLNWSIWF